MVAQTFYTLRHKLFPSFEPKRYHLQFRHAALVTLMLTCASFLLPAFHQTKPWDQTPDYAGSPDLPVESSYKRIYRFVNGILYFNEVIALWMALILIGEGFLQRSSPVWLEFAWMGIAIVGELVCLGLMASSRPDACDYHFGVDGEIGPVGKMTPINSVTSICSNWKGMTGQLATILLLFMVHVAWHAIIAARYMRSRPGYFTTPIPEYRWTLGRALDRLEPEVPESDIEKAAAKEKQLETASTEYTSRGTESFSFPITPNTEEYSNFSRLPANPKPVVLVQSSVTKSDTSSIVETGTTGKDQLPFSYGSK